MLQNKMVGKKLNLLLKEITTSQAKILLYKCTLSNDKRFQILKSLISIRQIDEDEINDFIQKQINLNWKFVSEKENQLKWRRLNHFITEQIELVIIESYLEKNTIAKNSILANSLEKNGNIQLVKNYYQSVYKSAQIEKNSTLQITSIEGLIKLSSYTQSNEDLEKTLLLSEQFIQVLAKIQSAKTADYYATISTIYLEKTGIVQLKKDQLILAILQLLTTENDELNRASLFASLAKLHVNEGSFYHYFNKAKEILNSIETNTSTTITIKQHFLFLELRIEFFSGATIQKLKEIINAFSLHNDGNSNFNLNSIFYRILFLILENQTEIADIEIKENESIYKGENLIYIQFLKALNYYLKNEKKKSIRLLNELVYSNNYFFSAFSRLLLIKIQSEIGDRHLCKSYITSTQNYLKQNKDNILGKDSNQYVLNQLKKIYSTKKVKEEKNEKLSILHQFILK